MPPVTVSPVPVRAQISREQAEEGSGLVTGEDELAAHRVCHDPQVTASSEFPGGHADLGIAHGISGPLALLTQALRRDVTVDGHRRNE
jgi:hypothetical protein